MAYPEAYSAFRRTTGKLPLTISPSHETLPKELGSHDVVIKIRAVSLNYRDVAMLIGTYPVPTEEKGIPCSDCAAEVVAKGAAVEGFAVGDHVAPITGIGKLEPYDDGISVGIGVNAAGVLREYAVFEDKHLVHLPAHLSWEEGSTLACAGVTAWNALDGLSHIPKGASALLQGTGGVSMFALLICLSAGIRPIITSSSDKKLEAIQKLSPEVRGINYKTVSDQAAEINRITNGRGVDFVINNTGPGSIPDDIGFLCQRGGTVSLVGFLDGFEANWEPKRLVELMAKGAKIKGIGVGSKADFEELNRYLEEKNIRLTPALDRVFSFEQSKEAFDYLYSGKHMGKIIIKLE
ncbi:NAD(P)-binding protein [Delitschia confertaspora ATCC 74209]|uniref:NAD(P)-binding protein n=1 Tax=Delitschia confertaspora ATCC 74209 TaxID=1513339 RepID=A0A9P4JP20_9PLEO|nr:NAD(P)-binding protein [Delitschia confertaspora ATCC 74209]